LPKPFGQIAVDDDLFVFEIDIMLGNMTGNMYIKIS